MDITGEVLTLAIDALRDISESKRMPSGLSVTNEIAAAHEDAANQLETWRAAIRKRSRIELSEPEETSQGARREDELS
jgi:hypothetical protein